jgi:hypothetical protein
MDLFREGRWHCLLRLYYEINRIYSIWGGRLEFGALLGLVGLGGCQNIWHVKAG